ncbi:hypothetical protein ACFE04_024944 [Oxalis oulophora]
MASTTTLLRKVWELLLYNNNNHRRSTSSSLIITNGRHHPSSMGPLLDLLPLDVVMIIVKLVGAKEAAKLSVVCKMLRSVVQDNRLWIHFFHISPDFQPVDFVFFSETYLRSRYPNQIIVDDMHLMRIYAMRTQVPGSVIIDGGSGYCKFGWSKYVSPSGRTATFLEFGNIESPMYSRLRHFFGAIFNRMQVKPSMQPVVVSVPLCNYDDTQSAKASRRQLKEAIYTVLFDMQVPAVCAINQATLALYAAKRTSGIVVNIGFHVTSVVPILNGKVMRRKVGVEVMGIGALKLTGFLREAMQRNNINFGSLYTVRTLKEHLCYVAADYKAELLKDTQASMQIPGEGLITLSDERFQVGEILFQPGLAGVQTMGLDQAVALCIDHCHDAVLTGDDSWFKTIVLTGGSACLPGLAERLEKELRKICPSSLSSGIRVIPPPNGGDTAWHGAKVISNLSTFPDPWCMTKSQFRRKSRLSIMW